MSSPLSAAESRTDAMLSGAGADSGAAHVRPDSERRRWGRMKLLGVLLVCLAPVVASYLAYYVFKPEGRTNYGTLIDPQRPIPPLALTDMDGKAFDLTQMRGRFVLLHVDRAACGEPCARKLWLMRQLRLTTGKDRDRVERVWLIEDGGAVNPQVPEAYEGTVLLRAEAATGELQPWLPAQPGMRDGAEGGTRISDHIYVIDPLGNLMMRFPKDADPERMKKDLSKLMRATSNWMITREPS